MRNKIVVAEDEPHITKLLKLKLEKDGFEVICARDGKEAYELTKKMKPALVLLDISLPVLNGFQITEKLRADPELKDIPIAMLCFEEKLEKQKRVKDLKLASEVTP